MYLTSRNKLPERKRPCTSPWQKHEFSSVWLHFHHLYKPMQEPTCVLLVKRRSNISWYCTHTYKHLIYTDVTYRYFYYTFQTQLFNGILLICKRGIWPENPLCSYVDEMNGRLKSTNFLREKYSERRTFSGFEDLYFTS